MPLSCQKEQMLLTVKTQTSSQTKSSSLYEYVQMRAFYLHRVGEHNKASDSDDHEATHQVKRITVHYKYRRLNNDIAILELEKPVVMNKWVSPVCLPNKDVPVGTECYITGKMLLL